MNIEDFKKFKGEEEQEEKVEEQEQEEKQPTTQDFYADYISKTVKN